MNNFKKNQLCYNPLLQKCNDHYSNRNLKYCQILTQKKGPQTFQERKSDSKETKIFKKQ